MASLLAVDLGLKTGLALYGEAGRLCWYRSRNLGSPARLRRAVPGLLSEIPDLTWLIVEGGGPLAKVWLREARRRDILVQQISAEMWRTQLLLAREQRRGVDAKQRAGELALRVIEWSRAARPTSALRHDAAEAILIGLWGVVQIGWLDEVPPEVRRSA